MIEYDYVIRRNEQDEIRDYKPSLIPQTLSDVCYIQGPNSCGKSTLLNLIALGFFAEKLKEDELNPALREKIERLHKSFHQQLTFEVRIDNKEIGETLISKKNNFDSLDFSVEKLSNGKTNLISSNEFFKEYKIIYDIPSDPIKRLPELLKELKNSQGLATENIEQLRIFVDENIRDIKNGYNPVRLKELYDKLKKIDEDLNEYSTKIKKHEDLLSWLVKYKVLKLYFDYIKKDKEIKNEISNISEKIAKTTKRIKKSSKYEIDVILNARGKIEFVKKLFEEITSLLDLLINNKQDEHLIIWKTIDCEEEIKNSQLHDDLKKEIVYFTKLLKQLDLDVLDDQTFSEARLLQELINLLNDFKHKDIQVPGTNKKVDEFIDLLQNLITDKVDILNKNDNINNCLNLLDKLSNNLAIAIGNYKEVLKLKSTSKDSDSENIENDLLQEEFGKAQQRKILIGEKLDLYTKELKNNNISIDEAEKRYKELMTNLIRFEKYSHSSEQQLTEAIDHIKSILYETQKLQSSSIRDKDITHEEKQRIENKEPHKYQSHLEKLEIIRTKIFDLERKFSVKFRQNIQKIMHANVQNNRLTDDENIYANLVSDFLAQKVRYIRHNSDIYEVTKINIITEIISTKKGKEILFTDLGTGHGQSAYLMGLLNMNDNRKIIALFDEVAMMDSDTLKPIFDKLVELYKAKRLLLALIVQRLDKEVIIKSLI